MTNQTKFRVSTTASFQQTGHFFSMASPYWIYLFLGVLAIGYGCLTLNGYGNHDDIYRMIGTWRTLLSEQRYAPSRFQGYLVPELLIGLSSQVGDFYLSNLVSTGLAIASLLIFYRLLIRIVLPLPAALAAFAVGTNPYWIIAATTSTDYIYPAFFFMLGLWFLVNHRFRVAGCVFALAVSSRLTYGPMVAIAFGFYFFYWRQQRRINYLFFQGIILFILGGIALYLPVFFSAGMTLSFLNYANDASGGTLGNIARFFYKNIYLWGLLAFLVLGVFFVQERWFYWTQIKQFPFRRPTIKKLIFHGVFGLLIYNQLLFAKLPHQYQYLIPVLFCVVFFVTQFPNLHKQVICLGLVALLQLVHGVVNFDVLETYQRQGANNTIHADGAVVKPGIREGILLRDYRWRSQYQRRMTHDFNQRWQHFGRSLTNPR
ncbi:MAG: hypothetical protein NW220_19975 [Leptolyngbyaceae cyanobacterium bins.349]|nr:hypothetical protein [Leptolyngbyaceae cyanobacterium bins.349]